MFIIKHLMTPREIGGPDSGLPDEGLNLIFSKLALNS